MTKNELLRILEHVPGDPEIIIREPDAPECGTGIGPVEKKGSFFVRNQWIDSQRGDIYDRDWSADDADMTESEWEKYKMENQDVIVLNLDR